LDLSQQPSGYEPDDLPGCSTSQKHHNTQLRFFNKCPFAGLALSLPDELFGSSTPRIDIAGLGALLRFPGARLVPHNPSNQRITSGFPVIQEQSTEALLIGCGYRILSQERVK
jgi:hypothetical protein